MPTETRGPIERSTSPESGANIKVAVRCRPFNKREVEAKSSSVVIINNRKDLDLIDEDGAATYLFDHVFAPVSEQHVVYQEMVAPLISEAWRGYTCAVLAYGQTSNSKTHTMQGDLTMDANGEPTPGAGILPRTLLDVLKLSRASNDQGTRCSVAFSAVQIYNERFYDMLAVKPVKGEPVPIDSRSATKVAIDGLAAIARLTNLLKDALGGNAKTAFIVAISAASTNYSETKKTLQTALSLKNVQTKPKISTRNNLTASPRIRTSRSASHSPPSHPPPPTTDLSAAAARTDSGVKLVPDIIDALPHLGETTNSLTTAAEKLDGAARDLRDAAGGMTLEMRELVGEVKGDTTRAVQVVAGISGDLRAISGGVAKDLRMASSHISGDLNDLRTTSSNISRDLRVFSGEIEQNLHKLNDLTNQFTKVISKSHQDAGGIVVPPAPVFSPNKSRDGFFDVPIAIKVGRIQGERRGRVQPLFTHKRSPVKKVSAASGPRNHALELSQIGVADIGRSAQVRIARRSRVCGLVWAGAWIAVKVLIEELVKLDAAISSAVAGIDSVQLDDGGTGHVDGGTLRIREAAVSRRLDAVRVRVESCFKVLAIEGAIEKVLGIEETRGEKTAPVMDLDG
ncbi:Kinesin- protein 11 [Allomyces javanicus]|nr:Kinesin- protein 11 [Allomyces javanicus]